MCSMKAASSFWRCWYKVGWVHHVALERINVGSKCGMTMVMRDIELKQHEAVSHKGKYVSTWEWVCILQEVYKSLIKHCVP